MRVALVRWREERDGDLTQFVPDVDLDQLDSWGVIDLRGSGKAHQSSADGVALMVAPNLDTAIPGALIDLGDDHQTRLGTTVGRALANRLGLNLVEATPGRIAAELLTLHARADDDSKPNPLVGERRFPRSKTDLRRRARVWCAGVLLYDELGAHVDEEMAYYAETFPTAGALTSSQDLPWDSLNPNAAVYVSTVAVGVRAAVNSSSVGVGVARTEVGVGSADMWASGSLWYFGNGVGGVGTVVRMSSSTGSAGYLGMISPLSGGVRQIMLYRMASDRALTSLAASPNLGTGAVPNQTLLELRTEANGSTIAAVYNSTAYGTTDTVITEGDRGGMCFDRGGSGQYRIYAFAMGQIGEGPGGGGELVEGTASADLGGLTATATGTVTVVGTATSDLGGLSATASGTVTVVGTATGQLGGLTGTSTGQRHVYGTATADLGGLDAHATGEGATTVEGEATGDLGGLTGTASGTVTVVGSATSTLGGLSGTASGTVTVLGTAAAVLGGVTAEATGTVITIGHAASQLGALTATAIGQRTVHGQAAAHLGGLTAAVNIVTADAYALSITIRETGHRVTIRETGHRVSIRERGGVSTR